MTSVQVAAMSSPRPVFITSKKPFRRVHPATIRHWIKDTLKAAGVDTDRFTAHSTRGASTSCAQIKGVLILEILRVANWTTSSTFERFYYRQPHASTFTRAVLQDSRYMISNCMCFEHTTT